MEVCQSFSIIRSLFVYDRLDVIIYENNVLWEVTIPKYKIFFKKECKQVQDLNVFGYNIFCAIFITHVYENNILRSHGK